jgi:hypothetical protein
MQNFLTHGLQRIMSSIDIACFDAKEITCELVNTGDTPRMKLTYGPLHHPLTLETPPCVLEWPFLTGNGNMGTKYGPQEALKAQYTVCVTDKPVPASMESAAQHQADMQRFFTVIAAIDEVVAQFAHTHQSELLGVHSLSTEVIKSMGNCAVKSKPYYLRSNRSYKCMNLGTRKFTWDGEGRSLKVVDSAGRPLPADKPLRHKDVGIVALQLNYVYSGTGSAHFGVKWAITEAVLLKRGPKACTTGTSAGVPPWARPRSTQVPKTQDSRLDPNSDEFDFLMYELNRSPRSP